MSALLHWLDEASDHASAVDHLFASITGLVLLLSAPVFVLTLAFAVKYRRGRAVDRRPAPNRIIWLEISWAGIPFVLLVGFYIRATQLYAELYQAPPGAVQIDVVAKQWMWKFQHPEGQAEINELHVPVGQPVTLTLASQDVIHSLYIPALRIKQDAVPGRYAHIWFKANEPGVYRLACAEFCGTDHSVMGGSFIVMAPEGYADWLRRSGTDLSLAAQGAVLFHSKGCSGCHGPSATVHAPKLEGVFGSMVPLQDGRVVPADAAYLRDSILLPQADIAAGYPAIMPTFQNILSEEEVQKLVAYVESLADARTPQ